MSINIYSIENCYVCNSALGPCRNSLNSLTSFTESTLFDTLELITGADLDDTLTHKTSVCQECFITLEKFDELHQQQDIIRKKVETLFHKTHSVQVFIKQESDTLDEGIIESNSSVKIKCQKCKESFSSLRELADHKHDHQPSRQTRSQTKSKFENSQVSKKFESSIKKDGIGYNYEMFQRAFFTENEKDGFKKPKKLPDDEQKQLKLVVDNKEVSDNFRSFAEDNGIDYNIESFQKAFGYSANESIKSVKKQPVAVSGVTSKGERWVMGTREKAVKPSVKPSVKPKINPTLVKALRAEGIDYNLETFQKAFGCVDPKDFANQITAGTVQVEGYEKLVAQGYLECDHCKARFTNRQSFIRHTRTHEIKDVNLYCEECSKSFKSTDCLQIHLATDHGRSKGEVDCPICLKTCIDANALRSHYYIHKTVRSFLCGKCGATFVHKKSFVSHMMMHDDLRPFACTIPGCSKKFRNREKLKIHLRVHTGEKIYECPLCPGRRFAQKWGLDLHTKKQHRNEIAHRETCQICGIKVQSKSKLKIHLAKTHQVASDDQATGMEISE